MKMRALLVPPLLLLAATAHAEPPLASPTAQARVHFQTGLQQAQQGDFVAALHEFETAYATAPHFSVLYNIAQTRATLGRRVEAVAAFEQYLKDGGERIPEARRREVAELLEANRSRIGQLQLNVAPNTALRAWLDGRELAREQLGVPIFVPTGEHTVVFWNGEGFLDSRVVTVTHSAIAELQATAKAATQAGRFAQLAITCDVPDVDVEINGVVRAKTPVMAPWLVTSRPTSLRFSRAGYTLVARSVTTTAGELTTVACAVHEVFPLPPALAGTLIVRATPSDARVTVDGGRFVSGTLPVGIHRLRIEHDGYQPAARAISLTSGRPTVYPLTLAPTAATLERQRRAYARRTAWGLALGGTGVAFLASGVGVYAWNSGRYDDWHALDVANHARDTQHAVSIQRVDDASFGLMALGAALTLGGAWLFWGGD